MKTCDFKALTAYENLKHDEKAQDANDMQTISVLYLTQLEATP